jgi:hypothetical protein
MVDCPGCARQFGTHASLAAHRRRGCKRTARAMEEEEIRQVVRAPPRFQGNVADLTVPFKAHHLELLVELSRAVDLMLKYINTDV